MKWWDKTQDKKKNLEDKLLEAQQNHITTTIKLMEVETRLENLETTMIMEHQDIKAIEIQWTTIQTQLYCNNKRIDQEVAAIWTLQEIIMEEPKTLQVVKDQVTGIVFNSYLMRVTLMKPIVRF